jgi:O-antigen/teichoic acid export membrane protein
VRLEDKLVAGVRAYTSLRLITQIASWLGTVYVVRHLTSHALGQYGVAFVVFSYLAMTYDGTLLEALIQRAPVSAHERRAVFTLVVGLGIALAGGTVACSGLVARWVVDPAVAPLVMGVGVVLALSGFSVLPNAMLAREMAFSRLATIAAIQSVCVLVVTVSLAWRGAGAWALLGGLMAGAFVRMALLNAASWGLARPTLRLAPALAYLRFGGVLLLDNVLWRWYTSLDTLLLARWSGTTSLGYYSLAQQIAELPLEKIARVVNDISLPAYATLREDRSAAGRLLLETLRIHATVGFPVFWGIAAVGRLFVPVVFGARWHLAVFPLAALAAVAPLRLIASIETPAMTGLGCPEVLIRAKLVLVPGMTAALLAGCWLGGIDGAALAWACAFPVCGGVAFRWVLRAAAVSYRDVLSVIRGPAVSAAVMAAAVFGWEQTSDSWGVSPVLGLAAAIALGALLYCAGLRLLDPNAFRLARSRVGRLVGLRSAL